MPMMQDERLARIELVASKRQIDLTVVLENVHDPHNIGAVLRTCDSVGIKEVFLLNNDPDLVRNPVIIGRGTSTGVRKWMDIHVFDDTVECFKTLRKKYSKVYGTHLDAESNSLYSLDLTDSIALVFGNEHAGITADTLEQLDGNFIIPQVGMVKSLNISVACAVTLYEAYRQREAKGYYDGSRLNKKDFTKIREGMIERHESRYKGRAHDYQYEDKN